MNLGFMTKWENGEPTYFVEKIFEGLTVNKLIPEEDFDLWYDDIENYGIDLNFKSHPKIHTIREDKKDRWKVGNKIHFVINNRQPNRFQFAPVIECTSVQEIEITSDTKVDLLKGLYKHNLPLVYIDGKLIQKASIVEELAINDGFNSIIDFFNYFPDGFKGKLIHWTNKIY